MELTQQMTVYDVIFIKQSEVSYNTRTYEESGNPSLEQSCHAGPNVFFIKYGTVLYVQVKYEVYEDL